MGDLFYPGNGENSVIFTSQNIFWKADPANLPLCQLGVAVAQAAPTGKEWLLREKP
jgi:hypothetical protein